MTKFGNFYQIPRMLVALEFGKFLPNFYDDRKFDRAGTLPRQKLYRYRESPHQTAPKDTNRILGDAASSEICCSQV